MGDPQQHDDDNDDDDEKRGRDGCDGGETRLIYAVALIVPFIAD